MVVARVPESSTPAQAYDACAEHGSQRSAPSTPSASGRERARKGPDRGWRDWSARRALQLAAVELADRCRRSAATSSDAARAAASSAGPALPGGPAPADAECEARDGPAPAHADPRLPGRPRRSHHGARVARRRRRSAQRAMRSMSPVLAPHEVLAGIQPPDASFRCRRCSRRSRSCAQAQPSTRHRCPGARRVDDREHRCAPLSLWRARHLSAGPLRLLGGALLENSSSSLLLKHPF